MIKKTTIILLMLLVSISAFSEVINFVGSVIDIKGVPIAAAVVRNQEEFALTDKNGRFALEVKSTGKILITCSLVGFQTEELQINVEKLQKEYIFVLERATEEYYNEIKRNKRVKFSAISPHIGYGFRYSNFDNFTEFKPEQIELLNQNQNYLTLGVMSYIKNIYINFDFAISPNRSDKLHNYRHITNSYYGNLDVGYGFSVLKNNRLIITPHIGVSHLHFSEYVAPLESSLPLEDYLQQGYMGIRISQFTATIGCDFSFKLIQFGKYKRHHFYLTTGVSYNPKLNKYPSIRTTGTNLTTKSTINLLPLSVNINFNYFFAWRQK